MTGPAQTNSAKKIERILIVRLSAMGDVIHTLPAAQALRNAFPEAMIGWLIEERWSELLCAPGTPRRGPRSPQRPIADWVHTVSLKKWRKEPSTLTTFQQAATVWNDIRATHYDVAIDLQGAIRSALLARLSGARAVWGATDPRESPASLFYTRRIPVRGAHVIEQNLSIVEAITKQPAQPPPAQLPHSPEAESKISNDLQILNLKNFAILNPGAGWGAKRWPADRYARVAARLADQGLRSIINFGPGEEPMAQEVARESNNAAIPMQCTITELITLTRRATLFIGGDTGPLHLAAALQIPVVAIFGPTDPARNGPYATRSIVLRSADSITSHARRAAPDQSLLEITVDQVVQAAQKLLTGAAHERAHG